MEQALREHEKLLQQMREQPKYNSQSFNDIQSLVYGLALQQGQYFRVAPRTAEGESPVDSPSRGLATSIRTTRIEKVDFPMFGGEDLQGWLYICDHLVCHG